MVNYKGKFRKFSRKFERLSEDLIEYAKLNLSGNKIQRLTDFRSCDRPILLIYGFAGTRRIFTVLEKRLRKDGYCVFSIHLGGLLGTYNTGGIIKSAELIKKKVDKLFELYELGPLTIIGYSKGGLIGSYYVKNLGGDKRVCNLITLGTPHNGTLWALLGLLSPLAIVSKSVRQMWPGAPLLRELRKKLIPKHINYVSIYSTTDSVCPYPSCVLDEERSKNIEMHEVSHTQFVLARRVYEQIRGEIEDGLKKAAKYFGGSANGQQVCEVKKPQSKANDHGVSAMG